jgi:hypothetical protein
MDTGYGDGSGGGGDGGDLMAYNAYPSELQSYGNAFGGGGMLMSQEQQQFGEQQNSQQQQQQQQHPQQQQQQQQHQQLQQQQQQQLLLQQQQAQALALAQTQANAQQFVLAPQAPAGGVGQAPRAQQPQPRGPLTGAATNGGASPSAKKADADDEDPGYLETLWQRRRDVAKLCVLALTVLLAISAHSAAWHYLREYIETSAKLTFWQELGVRAAYPAAVLVVLWNMKAFL